jgi:hypothetical protein
MIRSIVKLGLVIMAFLALSAFTGQPSEERQAQEELPQSHDRMWQILGKTRIGFDEKKEIYTAGIPDAVKALAGKQVTVSGFILPLEPTETFKHFILSRNTPTCAFCLPGEPNEIIDVWLEKPIGWDEGMVKVTGTFELTSDQEMGMFFRIKEGKRQ